MIVKSYRPEAALHLWLRQSRANKRDLPRRRKYAGTTCVRFQRRSEFCLSPFLRIGAHPRLYIRWLRRYCNVHVCIFITLFFTKCSSYRATKSISSDQSVGTINSIAFISYYNFILWRAVHISSNCIYLKIVILRRDYFLFLFLYVQLHYWQRNCSKSNIVFSKKMPLFVHLRAKKMWQRFSVNNYLLIMLFRCATYLLRLLGFIFSISRWSEMNRGAKIKD